MSGEEQREALVSPTMTLDELARVLGKSPATLKSQMSRDPSSLPPSFKPPRSRIPLFYRPTVMKWLVAQAGLAGALPEDVSIDVESDTDARPPRRGKRQKRREG